VALFQLESSSNEEMEFECVRFRELGCGCFESIRTPSRLESDTRPNWMINVAGSFRLLPGPQPFSVKQEARSS
jgi:hypothetical protein